MKARTTTIAILFVIALLTFTGCSSLNRPADGAHASTKNNPETVLVTYHVTAGKEAEFAALLSRAWQIYRKDRLVFAEPHVVVQDKEGEGKPRFIEIFTWVSRSIPENAPDSVKTIWKEEEGLCEQRNGHYGIEPNEVELILPSRNN